MSNKQSLPKIIKANDPLAKNAPLMEYPELKTKEANKETA